MGKAKRLRAAKTATTTIVLAVEDYQMLKIAALSEEVLQAKCRALLKEAEEARAGAFRLLAQKYPLSLEANYGFDDAQHALIAKG